MTGRADNTVGRQNAKTDDTDIQGHKGGTRNRAEQEAGAMPPPAGESKPKGGDPRRKMTTRVTSRGDA
jgi:hypothetical protein